MSRTAQNTFFLTAGAIAQKIIAFVYFTVIARLLGAENTGKYVFALTFTTLFSVLADVGIAPAINRAIAREPKDAERYLHTALVTKIFLALCTYAIAVIAVHVMGYPEDIRLLVYLSGVTMIFDSLHLTFYAVLRGFQNLKYEAVGVVGSQFVTLILGGTALFMGLPLFFLILAFTIPSFLNMCFAAFILKKKYRLRLFAWPAEASLKIQQVMGVAWAFALAGIFSRIYSSIDTVLLSKMDGTAAVGVYSIPNKMAFAFQFIPLALSASIFPAMSNLYRESPEKVRPLFVQSMHYMMLVGFPIAAGLSALSEEIVIYFYGFDYVGSIVPLKILMASLVFAFLAYPIGAILNACNKQHIQTAVMGATVIINVLANIILIPRLHVVGAAIAALLGNVFLCVCGFVLSGRLKGVAPLPIIPLVKSFVLIAIAAGIMFMAVWYMRFYIPWPATIPCGAIVYVGLIFLFGIVDKEKLAPLFGLFKRQAI